jgi:uncharacterized membrane protein YqhA
MQQLIDSWLTWLGLGGLGVGALLAAAWFFGLMPIIGAIATVVAGVLTPILKAIVEGMIWLWANVFWPGIVDILDDWVTIVTVAVMGGMLYLAIVGGYEYQLALSERQTNVCQAALKKATAKQPARKPAPKKPSLFGW